MQKVRTESLLTVMWHREALSLLRQLKATTLRTDTNNKKKRAPRGFRAVSYQSGCPGPGLNWDLIRGY